MSSLQFSFVRSSFSSRFLSRFSSSTFRSFHSINSLPSLPVHFHSSFPSVRHFSSSSSKPWVDPAAVPKGDYLKKYCIDITELAKKQKLDPVVGREEEMRRTIEILCRRTKNNPAIIGEPGVGKLR
jgi:ATP-dependent Clp protease ATP-binding subunit ClpA